MSTTTLPPVGGLSPEGEATAYEIWLNGFNAGMIYELGRQVGLAQGKNDPAEIGKAFRLGVETGLKQAAEKVADGVRYGLTARGERATDRRPRRASASRRLMVVRHEGGAR